MPTGVPFSQWFDRPEWHAKRDKAGPISKYIGGIDTIETWHLSYISLCLWVQPLEEFFVKHFLGNKLRVKTSNFNWKSIPFTWRELSMARLLQHDLVHEGKIATRLGFSGKMVNAE